MPDVPSSFLPLAEATQRCGLIYGRLYKWWKRGLVRGSLSPELAAGELHAGRPARDDSGSRLERPAHEPKIRWIVGEWPAGTLTTA